MTTSAARTAPRRVDADADPAHRLRRLAHAEYHGVASLFGPGYPNLAFVHAVIERRIPGTIWAWPGVAEDASACLITTSASFCFVAGEITPRMLEAVFAELRPRAPVTLVHPRDAAIEHAPLPEGLVHARRLQYSSVRPGTEVPVAHLPDGYELSRIDAAAFAHINWSATVLGIFGSAEQYLEHAHGFGIHHDGQLVAEAHSVVGGGRAEVGIFTDPAHRLKGLSWVAVNAVTRFALLTGLTVVATFDVHATASRILAERLGLVLDGEYGVIALPADEGGRVDR